MHSGDSSAGCNISNQKIIIVQIGSDCSDCALKLGMFTKGPSNGAKSLPVELFWLELWKYIILTASFLCLFSMSEL